MGNLQLSQKQYRGLAFLSVTILFIFIILFGLILPDVKNLEIEKELVILGEFLVKTFFSFLILPFIFLTLFFFWNTQDKEDKKVKEV